MIHFSDRHCRKKWNHILWSTRFSRKCCGL